MATPASFTENKLRIENLSVICSNDEVTPTSVREFFLKKWEFIRQELDNGTIVFIAGAHGSKEGNLLALDKSCITMARQVCDES